jgi:PAS domain S-box-containing protein
MRVLLVEDSPSDEKLVRHALRGCGPDVVLERVDTPDAFRRLLSSGSWDAVISDWSVPGFGALAALDIVRTCKVDLPFIIVSGTVGEDLAVEAMRAGAHDYVLKHALARLAPVLDREIRESKLRADSRRNDARFRALIEKSNDAIVLTTFDGIATYASPAAATIFGVGLNELLGRRPGDFVHPDDRVAARAENKKLREGHRSVSLEFRILRPDGSIRWVAMTNTNFLDDPDVEAAVANIRDITDSRLAADALRRSEARFARLAESGIIGILTCNLDGHIYDVNDAYRNMLGYSREELLSGSIKWLDLIPPELHAETFGIVEELVQRGVTRPFESVAIRKDGARVPMLCGVAMVETPICIAFSIDLSERKQAEEALRKSEEHLRQAQKMEAVGRLAGGIAHDFNNILSVIISYSEMMMADLDDSDPKSSDLAEIFQAGKRAAELTRQLLMFSRQQVIEPKILDLNQVTGNMDKMLRRVLGEDVELVTVRSEALGRVKVDPSSIEQVIMNLVVNARDAMPTGGKLTLETANVMLDDAYVAQHGGASAGPHVMLAVSDTGCGMDQATQARIFEPFFTTKPKDRGTGLGLSTVFGIVQQAGGSVWVYSEPGVGTTFKIYLPRIVGALDRERSSMMPAMRGTETILLVEDEVQVRNVARGILQRHGYVVLDAPDPNDAIELCRDYQGDIHLLLTDVVMPKMSGPELAKVVCAIRPQLKVLCMSGYTDDSIVRHGILSAQLAFLQKPLTPVALTTRVREVLDRNADAP